MSSGLSLPPPVSELVEKLADFQMHSSSTDVELYLTDALYAMNTLDEVNKQLMQCHNVCYLELLKVKALLTEKVIQKLTQ